jgi:hypothetical protein
MRPGEAAVVVPVYRPTLDEHEALSLRQCVDVLGSHPLVLAAPRSLDIGAYPLRTAEVDQVLRFDDSCFTGRDAYNRLLLAPVFYDSLRRFRYILIHQLDAFAFSDELCSWCDRGYDYVGAPWLEAWPERVFRSIMSSGGRLARTMKRGLCCAHGRNIRVGNGGFSLRKVSSFRRVARLARPVAAAWTRNEDVFWAMWAPNFTPGFCVPSMDEAMAFCVETAPRAAFASLGARLPFGCHAWTRHDPEFMQPFIDSARGGVLTPRGCPRP